MKRAKRDGASGFVTNLTALRFDNAFNPYTEACPDHDDVHAPSIRRRNLELVLEAAMKNGVHSFWIARDLGYRGGRRTGLALTDDVHIMCHARLLGTPPLARATKGPPVAERTASVVWRLLLAINRPIFLWNVFPLHPHAPGDPMSNRCHTRAERAACRPIFIWLLEVLRPRSIIAIGRDAQNALADIGISAIAARHPSYGGQSEFVSTVAAHYGLSHLSDGLLPKSRPSLIDTQTSATAPGANVNAMH